MSGSTTARGYGAAHQKTRARWARKLATLGTIPCARCGTPIHHGDPWDLGHTDDRTAYTGPEHVTCNRGAGGRNGARTTNQRQQTTTRTWG